MSKYNLGAASDIGVERESQEDFVQFRELDNDNLLAVIADGTGSAKGYLQPAVIASMNIIQEIEQIYNESKEMLLYYVDFFLKRALLHANQVLGAYKMGNEETFSGYATSLTVALFTADNRAHIAHVGNTRFYILRNSKIIQLTKDQTKAQELLDAGEIDEQTYYVHPYRLNITDGLGISTLPNISNICVSITDTDLFLMTTDGIHYAIRPENMKELVLSGQDVVPACNNLIDAAKNIIKYPDNMLSLIHISEPTRPY